VHEVLIEESVLGWKEYELELMRDRADNVVVVCSIENLDPMGVHTGDSITVAPAMTLTDREYQHMRDVGIAVLRAVGRRHRRLQHPVRRCHPDTGRLVVIEMNPRVSRSRAWPPRRPASRSPRSPPAGRRATPSTRSATTSPARPRPRSSRRWTTWW
jgi:carbamoyl-phosphate synthase large subunit